MNIWAYMQTIPATTSARDAILEAPKKIKLKISSGCALDPGDNWECSFNDQSWILWYVPKSPPQLVD